MNKIVFIAMYFGAAPAYLDVALYTFSRNTQLDMILFTDRDISFRAPNISVRKLTFEQLRTRIQEKFPFTITLEAPYKLCDFRPAFGWIFERELAQYAYWGHCDLDVVFGDLWKYLSEPVAAGYPKIYQNGHLTLYKNETAVNQMFLQGTVEKRGLRYDYQTVFSSGRSFAFDERNGIQQLFDQNAVGTYKKIGFADISPKYYSFRLDIGAEDPAYLFSVEDHKDQLFFWRDGHVYRCYYEATMREEEFLYLHFQKRDLRLPKDRRDLFDQILLILPEGFVPLDKSELTQEDLRRFRRIHLVRSIGMRSKFFLREGKRIWSHLADAVFKPW